MLTLYSSSKQKKLDLSPSNSDTLTREIMGDAVLSLSFTHWEHIPIEVGDYVVWEGERFTTLWRQYPLQISTQEWRYQLQLLGESARLKRYHLVSPDGDPIFTLTSPAAEHLRLIVATMNECEGGREWKVGRVVATDNLVIGYNCTTLDAALQLVAEAAHTEWWLEGKTLHLTRCEWGEALPLAYGEGLMNLEQGKADGHKTYTRIYPIGSSRNIDPTTYGAARLLLPGKAKFVDLPASKELGRIDHHEREAFAHIYPRRIGTISAVRTEQRTIEGKRAEVYFVKDDSLDFDPAAQLMAGKVMQFSFQEGADLAGREFECNWHAATREFELITKWLADGTTSLPNASLPPKVGDHYLLWNMKMPDSYLRAAEQELLQAVQAYNERHHLDLAVYKARTDFEHFERNAVKLRLGQRVNLKSKEFFEGGTRQSRISKMVQHLACPLMMDIEMSDTLARGALQRIHDEVGRVEQQVRRVEATLPQVLHVGDPSPASDNNVYSAARTHREFLTKTQADTAAGHITFSGGLSSKQLASLEQGATFGTFTPSLFGGSGAKIDERGNAEVESIKVRSRMEVAELVVNRQTTMDSDYLLTEGDVVERVFAEQDGSYTLVLRAQSEGYKTSFTKGSVLRGVYNNLREGGTTYETTWAKVEEVSGDGLQVRVSLYGANECPAGANYPPRPLLHIARWGHVSDALRQSTYLLSSRDQRIALMVNVTKPIVGVENIASWQGKLDGLMWRDSLGREQRLEGYGNVMGKLYVSGGLHVGGELSGAIADKVKEIEGKLEPEENLLMNGNESITNDNYLAKVYELSVSGKKLKEGEIVTFTIKGQLGAKKTEWGVYNTGGSVSLGRLKNIGGGYYRATFPWLITQGGKTAENTHVSVYALYFSNPDTSTIEWAKLVRGEDSSYEFVPSKDERMRYETEKATKAEEAKALLAEAKTALQRVSSDAFRDGIVSAAEGKAIARAKSEQVESEWHYLTARADAVLAAHPQLRETHRAEYEAIAASSNDNARRLYNEAVGTFTLALTAFANGDLRFGHKGRMYEIPPTLRELMNVRIEGKGLGAWYVERRNAFEAAIVAADRGKDGTNGVDGRSPYINASGTWEVWDDVRKTYVDTNDPARGDDGHSPRINGDYWEVWENGRWTSTGVKAKGENGKDGESVNGKDGRGIASITPLYKLHDSKTSAPAAPTANASNGWSEGKPFYEVGKFLWRCEEQRYSDDTKAFTTPMLESEWEALQQMQVGGQNYFGFGKGIVAQDFNNPPTANGTARTLSVRCAYVERPMPKVGGGGRLYGFRLDCVQVYSGQGTSTYAAYRQSAVLVRLARLGLPTRGKYAVRFRVRANRPIKGPTRAIFHVNLCDAPMTWFSPTREWQEVRFVADAQNYVADRDQHNLRGFLDIEVDSEAYNRSGSGSTAGYLQLGDWLEIDQLQIEMGSEHSDFRPSADYLTQLLFEPSGVGDGVVFGGRMDVKQGGETKAVFNGINLNETPVLAAGNIQYRDHKPIGANVEIWADGRTKLGKFEVQANGDITARDAHIKGRSVLSGLIVRELVEITPQNIDRFTDSSFSNTAYVKKLDVMKLGRWVEVSGFARHLVLHLPTLNDNDSNENAPEALRKPIRAFVGTDLLIYNCNASVHLNIQGAQTRSGGVVQLRNNEMAYLTCEIGKNSQGFEYIYWKALIAQYKQ